MTMLWGRFLECDPKVNRPQSFLEQRNSIELSLSNGVLALRPLRAFEHGFFRSACVKDEERVGRVDAGEYVVCVGGWVW